MKGITLIFLFLLSSTSFSGEKTYIFLSEYSYSYCEDEDNECLSNLDSFYIGEYIKLYLSRSKPSLESFISHFNETHKYMAIENLDVNGSGECSAMNVTNFSCEVKIESDSYGNYIIRFKSFDTGE